MSAPMMRFRFDCWRSDGLSAKLPTRAASRSTATQTAITARALLPSSTMLPGKGITLSVGIQLLQRDVELPFGELLDRRRTSEAEKNDRYGREQSRRSESLAE